MKYIFEVMLTAMLLFMIARLSMISFDLIDSPSDAKLLVGLAVLAVVGGAAYLLALWWIHIIATARKSLQDNQTKEKNNEVD